MDRNCRYEVYTYVTFRSEERLQAAVPYPYGSVPLGRPKIFGPPVQTERVMQVRGNTCATAGALVG
jgi:hypothetical protein